MEISWLALLYCIFKVTATGAAGVISLLVLTLLPASPVITFCSMLPALS